jgi:glycerate-2-kinase
MRAALEAWFRAALVRVDPAALVERALAGDDALRGATILAIGKAAGPMLAGAARALGPPAAWVGVAPDGAPAPAGVLRAGHPRPDARSAAAADALLAAARAASGPVVALISGGASALAARPGPGLDAAAKQAAIAALIARGAPIAEVNCVRRHLSSIKGGRLARAARGPVVTLAISDVPGDRLCDVGSGPTVPDPTAPADALVVLERRLGLAAPPAIRAHLEAAARGEGDPVLAAARPGDRASLLAPRRALVDAALAVAAERGVAATGWPAPLDGAVDEVAALLAGWIRHGDDPAIVAGGEPTIALPPSPGQGGRAQHLALLVARAIDGVAGAALLVAGSDGVDGTGPAAGAVIDGDTWSALRSAGIDPDGALLRADAGTALAAIGASITTGPTGSNHADLVIAISSRATVRFSM